MTAQTILPANSVVDSGFNVANSVNCGDESTRWSGSSKVTSTSQQIGSWNIWLKRTVLGAQGLFKVYEAANTGVEFGFDSSDQFFMKEFESGTDVFNLKTSAVFRDTSAWMNILLAIDTTQGTEANRIRLYINGVEPSLATSTRPSANTNLVRFFANSGDDSTQVHEMGNNYDGATGHYLLTQILHVDGTQLANTDVGEFDEDSGIWKPIDISETTLGNNGYYLSMEDSSNFGVATGKAMTAHGFAATDSRTDTCTNNFATMNPLDNFFAGSAFSEGNCKIVTTNGNITYNTSTIGFSSGKWYMEVKLGSSSGEVLGVVRGVSGANNNDNKIGNRSDGFGYDYRGLVEGNGSDLGGTFAAFDSGDVIGVYADLDNNELYFSKNGTLQNSGTGLTLPAGTYFFAVGDNHGSNAATFEVNFGNPVSALDNTAITDDNGYGAFEYSPNITGDSTAKKFYSLNTKNLGSNG